MEKNNKVPMGIVVTLIVLVIVLIGVMIALMIKMKSEVNNNNINFGNGTSSLPRNTKNVYNNDDMPMNKKIIFNNFFKIKSEKQNNAITNVAGEEIFTGPDQEYNQPSSIVYNFTDPNNQEKYLFIDLNLYDLQSIEKYENKKWEYFNVLEEVRDVLGGESTLNEDSFQSSNDLIFPSIPASCSTPTHSKFIKTNFLSGFRFTTNCTQEYAPIKTVTYFFDGLSNNGKYHITFEYSDLKVKSIEQYFSENPDEESSNEVNVIEKTTNLFENENDNNFTPSLLKIDKFIKSIQYK